MAKKKRLMSKLITVLQAERDLIVGGQAVIEGVMMRTPSAYAIAVRKPDGSIAHTSAALPKWSDKYPFLKAPVLRGGATLIQSMGLGIKALNYSAEQAFDEEEVAVAVAEKEKVVSLKPAVADGVDITENVTITSPKPAKPKSNKGQTAGAAGSIVFAIIFNILLFIVLPLLLTNALFVAVGWDKQPQAQVQQVQSVQTAPPASAQPTATADEPVYKRAWYSVKGYLKPVKPGVLFNLIDGLIRMFFFVVMIFSFSFMRDIKRVFQYHGAEHKTVFNWEAGLPLTVENARKQRRQHPRCGTSFLMVVMMVSIVLFSVIAFNSLLLNMSVRIALMPLVAGLSYEVIRFSAKKESGFIFKALTLPGIWLQNITTQEPDDDQLEVAIEALKESLKLEPQTENAAATA